MVSKLFGYAPEELVGRNVSVLTPPEVAANHGRYLERYAGGGGRGRVVGNIRVTEARRRDGSLFPAQIAVSAASVGGARYFVGVIADITQRLENERLLREARDAALSSTRLKAEFLATMSHEIRTPMNGILGMAQLLVEEGISEEERRQCARVVLSSSETLITLLNDILDLSKVESGQLDLGTEPASPATLAEQAAALFVESAHAKGLQITVTASAASRGRYVLDPARVRQMLSNLVGNAVKFTDAGSIGVDTAVEEGPEGSSTLVFRVADTGPGIAADKQQILFHRYSQVDTSSTRRHGGTGLGLSIVRRFAAAMGGTVGVESDPGKGSCFWFAIPARKPVEDDAPRAPDEGLAAVSGASSREADSFDGRVLIAEDIAANRMFLQLALRKFGISTESASDGRQAVEVFVAKGPFDCVFMDVQMPEMDGEEATRQIRLWESVASASRCPVVAVTANAYEDDRRRCAEAGMDDFIAKPVQLAELRRVLGRWMTSKGAGR